MQEKTHTTQKPIVTTESIKKHEKNPSQRSRELEIYICNQSH